MRSADQICLEPLWKPEVLSTENLWKDLIFICLYGSWILEYLFNLGAEAFNSAKHVSVSLKISVHSGILLKREICGLFILQLCSKGIKKNFLWKVAISDTQDKNASIFLTNLLQSLTSLVKVLGYVNA